MGLITDTLHTVGDSLTNFVENPSLDSFIGATPVGIVGSVLDNNVKPALDTLGSDLTNSFDSFVGGVGDAFNGVVDTLGNVVNKVGGSVLDTLMMPLMVIGGLGLGFMLLQRK